MANVGFGGRLGQHGGPVAEVKLSVVMPAHNEEDLLNKAVHAVVGGLRDRRLAFEVVVVENGSSDRTAEIASALAEDVAEVRWLTAPEPDYGRALRAGFLAASGEVVVNFDVDYADLGFFDAATREVGAEAGPVIVVENGSKDRTAALGHALADEVAEVRAFSSAEADYGRALRAGFLAAAGD
ncbi:MAG: glycosyltransferase, partial [Acidimicrobiales bacterium]